jgi:hypothetical protein
LASTCSEVSEATMPAEWSPGDALSGTDSVKGTIAVDRPATATLFLAGTAQAPTSVDG